VIIDRSRLSRRLGRMVERSPATTWTAWSSPS